MRSIGIGRSTPSVALQIRIRVIGRFMYVCACMHQFGVKMGICIYTALWCPYFA